VAAAPVTTASSNFSNTSRAQDPSTATWLRW